MSDYTRDALVAEAREEAEATGSTRWSDALVLKRFDMVFVNEWRRILAANPLYRWALRSVAANGSAQILWTALDSGTADAKEYFHKVLAVGRESALYEESRFEDHPNLTSDGSGVSHLWWPEGDHLALTPGDANATIKVWVNHTPQRPSLLANGSSIVTFPRDYSHVLIYELAATLLAKGGAETDLALELKGMAAGVRSEMFDEIARRSVGPAFVRPVDTAAEWGA